METPVFAISCVIFAASLVAVGLRLYSRWLTVGFGWDDGFILTAVALEIALFTVSIYLWNGGHCRISLSHVNNSMLSMLLVFETLYLFSMCFTKLSAISLYMKIFVHKWFRTTCRITGFFIALLYIAVLVETFTLSELAAQIWGKEPFGIVVNSRKVDIGTAVFNVLSNVIVLLLPIKPIWGLQMRTRVKINLTILFSLGICVTVVSCVRISALVRADYMKAMTNVRDMHLRVLEPELAIFSLCLPLLRPYWDKIRESYGYVTHQLRSGYQFSRVTPSKLESHDGESSRPWREPTANVTTIKANTSISPADRLGFYNALKQKSKSVFVGNPTQKPEPVAIKVERSWYISYEAALGSR
ncbi:uncharacterized protein F4812DRAFT_458648 [Daldinia caldariorum]|uniref:uncharacterized protein n=1 Tax=Daldinia caldariorum TaxID=326644 RepID=UPI002007689E|nr:uncharacterized protein F4812DRAFT_458648 [Daldinia caldariorum]KAI1468216.1 hypothetical protein F4812DRAFT_458648 [Daldinia caldariorum]